MSKISATEEHFYSRYDWCLNPILSIRQLMSHFNEELDAYRASEGWQREECKINLYIFACAIACTTDDFFSQRLLNLSILRSHLPRLGFLLTAAEWLLNTFAAPLKILANWQAWRWRKRWNCSLHEICDLLIAGGELRMTWSLPQVHLPDRLLSRKMRLPEAFRGQDFTHHDVISLIKRFCASSRSNDDSVAIVGLRTAGAYFAPLMAAYLKRANWPHVSWFSIRPKNGTSPWEKRQLRKLAQSNTRVLVVDDYPATGATLRLTLNILQQSKITQEQISVLAPTHAAQPNWAELAGINDKISVFTVRPSELYKTALLRPEAIEQWCAGYFTSTESTRLRVIDDKRIEDLNKRLAEHSKDGHHVREKRVFAVQLSDSNSVPSTRKIFLKSVGWGWLGYHAYIAGKRLDDFVPGVFGLRNGLLITQWIDDAPEERNISGDQMANVLACYVATRSRSLPLAGDCRLESRTYRWAGLDEIVTILRHAYGPYIGRLKASSLRKELYKFVSSTPALIDGRMRPEEWLHTPVAIYKADFEHHNFGGAEVDLADPAYDLAAAIFEFQLTKQSEEQLLGTYIRISGDRTIAERIITYKILYASTAMRHAVARVVAGKAPQRNNDLHQYCRNFLVYSMNEFCAGLIGQPKPAGWSDSLFFVDLDGVFDRELLGFPHATQSGLQALKLLQSNGYSVVLNTGRSVQHVRRYCEAYGIPGGVAEFGSVFVDAVQKKELPIIDEGGARQLESCREAIRALPGVFVDPGYEYSIRAYRYKEGSTAGLSVHEARQLLETHEFSRLTYISRESDTYIVQKGTDKGAGVTFVKRCLNKDAPVAAIGDSEQDIPMLELSDYPYAPANCSPIVRRVAKTFHCHVLKQSWQAGLLAAVQHRLSNDGRRPEASSGLSPIPNQFTGPIQTLLCLADRPGSLKLLLLLANLVSWSM
jgi:hydroxymethylpyrimidine pyrophosphatase-like HAD family hydrolase